MTDSNPQARACRRDMAGFYEVRVQGGRNSHRLFCILERGADDLGSPSIVCIGGLPKPPRPRLNRVTIASSSSTAPSSRIGGPCLSSVRSRPTRLRSQLEVERTGEGDEGTQCGVWLLRREQPTDRLRFDTRASSKVGLREVELRPALVERANDPVDLVDPLLGLLVGGPILRLFEPFGQIALGTGGSLSHVTKGSRNVCVTPSLGVGGCHSRLGPYGRDRCGHPNVGANVAAALPQLDEAAFAPDEEHLTAAEN